MLDAYTVGITLALNNGVSEGVAAIRRDLVELNRAIDGSSAALIHLHQLADIMHVSSAALRLTQSAKGEALSTNQTEPTDARIVRPTDLPSNGVSTNPALLPTRVDESPTARAMADPATVADPFAVPTAFPTVPPPAVVPQRIDPGPLSPSSSDPPLSVQPVPDATAAAPIDQRDQSIRMDLTASSAPTQDYAQQANTRVRSAEVAPVTPRPVSTSSRRGADSDAHAPPPWSSPVGMPAPGSEASAPRRSPSEPFSPAVPSTTFSDYATGVSPTLPSAAPAAPDSRGEPMQGDVYLDGTRLGHWIDDHLAREADRPAAGTTNFDPRLSITWPGAPIS